MSSNEPLLIDDEDGGGSSYHGKVVSVEDYGKAVGQATQMGVTLRREQVGNHSKNLSHLLSSPYLA